jgi:acetyl-CoA synthetase (ADP-forming)
MKSATDGVAIEVDRGRVQKILQAARSEGRSFVLEPEAKEILRAYGVPTAKGRLCTTLEEALAAAREIGYPLAMKIVSPQVLHKTEMGGVKVNISSDEALREAHQAMLASVGSRVGQEAIRGVLVEAMARGHEVIIGASRDPQFGPLLMFGLGGIFVEILKDVSYRLAPIEPFEAQEMIREIKAYPLLAGARGGDPVDEGVLGAVLVRVSRLVDDFREIKELDLNPTFVEGSQVVVADARIIID